MKDAERSRWRGIAFAAFLALLLIHGAGSVSVARSDTASGAAAWFFRAAIRSTPNLSKRFSKQELPSTQKEGMRLSLERLAIDAAVVPVGLRKDGTMDIPPHPMVVGWYSLGRRPGQIGSAVLAGHLDAPGGVRGVFWRLNEVHIGDILAVSEGNQVVQFRVTDIRSYPYDDAPLDVLFGESAKSILRLITCNGSWNRTQGTYAERLVVSAERIDQ